MPDETSPAYRFEIAISFAGDDKRSKVRRVAELLRDDVGAGKVFFDEWFEAELAGPDAQTVLQNIYRKATRVVVACVCQRYNEKPWAQDEWRAIQSFERTLRDAGAENIERLRFLPLRFGDGETDGLLDTAIVPDVRERTPEQIAELVLSRLKLAKQEKSTASTAGTAPQISVDAAGPPPTYRIPELSEHFIGRDDDLKRVLDQVGRHRVVTITGIGGMGKSQLAKAVARAAEAQEWAAGGVYYVDLQAITDANLVKTSLTPYAKPKAGEPAGEPIPGQLAAHRLYVLDDVYQALVRDRKGIQDLVRALHDGAAPAHFLLTSREPVGVLGVEHPCPLGRLMPPHDEHLCRKVADGVGYRWRDGDADKLAALLEQLDGFPLAIEIAANWLCDSSLDIILKRWDRRHTSALNVPGISDRELSKMTSVDFSLALSVNNLPEGEVRALFALFADLPAGAKNEMLEAIMGEDVHAPLQHLIRCSLVHKQEDRYRMLVPVREFAALSRADAAATLHRKLDANLIEFARQWCGSSAVWNTPRRREALAALRAERLNIGAAAFRAKARQDSDFLHGLIGALWRFIASVRDDSSEELLRDGIAVARAHHDVLLEANCLQGLGDLYRMDNNKRESAQQHFEEALSLYQRIGEQSGEASCIEGLGDLQMQIDKPDAARERYEAAALLYRAQAEKLGEANCLRKIAELKDGDQQTAEDFTAPLNLFKDIGDELGEANCLRNIAAIRASLNESCEAQDLFERALALFRKLGDKPREGNVLMLLGRNCMRTDENQAAKKSFDQARMVFTEMGDHLGQGFCIASIEDLREKLAEWLDACLGRAESLRWLGNAHVMLDENDEAERCYLEALPLYRDFPISDGEAQCRKILGGLHFDAQDYPAAVEHYAEAIKLYADAGDQSNEADILHRSAVTHERLNQHQQAVNQFEQALSIYTGCADRPGQAKCFRGLGDVHLALHQLSEAMLKYQEALKLLESSDLADEIEATYWGVVSVCMEAGQRDEGLRWAEKAAQLFESIGEADRAEEARKHAAQWPHQAEMI
jgi:tetratricopeptide (TPR) repeat protein